MDSPLALTSGVTLAAALLLDRSFGAGAGGGGGGRRLGVGGGGGEGDGSSSSSSINVLSGGVSSSNHAAAGSSGAGSVLLLNATMKLETDLAHVCSNLTGMVGGVGVGGDGGGGGVGGGGVVGGGGGGACDTKALGISLSTPILMMSTGVLGNLLALLVLLTTDRKVRRAPFFPLLMAMACTDLVGQIATGVIAIIVYANDLKWVGGQPVCIYHGFMMVFLAVITPLLVCSMSVERLLALKFSYFYQRCFTNRLAKGIIVGSLAFTLFFSTLPLMGFGSYELQFPGSWCFLNYHRESLTDMIFALVFAGLNIIIIAFIILSNGVVVWTLLKMRRVRHQLRSSPSVEGTMSVIRKKPKSRSSALHLEMETQMVWFLMAITVVFSCLWLPINVHIVINQITGETNYKQDLITVRLASINQIIDPWMYIIFRKATFFKFLRRIKRLISRGKSSCGIYSSTDKPSSNHLSLMRRLPGRQCGPSALSSGSFRAKDQALDLLLPVPGTAGANCDLSGYRNHHGLMDVSPSDMEIEMSLNGPLHIIEGAAAGCDPNGPLRAIKEASHEDLEAACRPGAERHTSISESGGQGQLCLSALSFCEDECSKDTGRRESILGEEEKNLPEQRLERETVLRKNSRGPRGSTSSSSYQDETTTHSQESVNGDRRYAETKSHEHLVGSTEKSPSRQKERDRDSGRDAESCPGVISIILQDERRHQQTMDNICECKVRENPTETPGHGKDGGVHQFHEAGQGLSRGTVDEVDCTSQHSTSEDRNFHHAWEKNAQACFPDGVSRNDDANSVTGKQLKSSPEYGHTISIPNNDMNSSNSKKQHLWK